MGLFDIWWEGGCWEWWDNTLSISTRSLKSDSKCRDVAAGIAILQEAGGWSPLPTLQKTMLSRMLNSVAFISSHPVSASWGTVVQKSLCRHPAQIKNVVFTCYFVTLFIPTRMHLWRRCWLLSVLKPRRPIPNRIGSSRTGVDGARGLAKSTQSRLLSPRRIATCNRCTVWRSIFTIYLTKI